MQSAIFLNANFWGRVVQIQGDSDSYSASDHSFIEIFIKNNVIHKDRN